MLQQRAVPSGADVSTGCRPGGCPAGLQASQHGCCTCGGWLVHVGSCAGSAAREAVGALGPTAVGSAPRLSESANYCHISNAAAGPALPIRPPVFQVQCSVCGNLNDASQANQLGHVVCGGCQVTLAYAYGAQVGGPHQYARCMPGMQLCTCDTQDGQFAKSPCVSRCLAGNQCHMLAARHAPCIATCLLPSAVSH